jgi:hypothetical protein
MRVSGLPCDCRAFAFNPRYVYRDRARRRGVFSRHPVTLRPRPPLAFSIAEQNRLLGVLDSERFADTEPAAVYATLLDEGHYYGSERTMYRLLAAQSQVGDRRRQRRHPVYTKPELLAVRPNEVWSWDITQGTGQVDVLSLVRDPRYFQPLCRWLDDRPPRDRRARRAVDR